MSDKRRLIGTPLPFWTNIALGVVPFALMAAAYSYVSHQRHLENPQYWVLPNLAQFAEGFHDITTPDKRTETVSIAVDTSASLSRLGKGLAIGVLASVVLGLSMGLFSRAYALFSPLFTALAKVPPITLLPIFFMTLGTGDEAKIALVVAGIAPTLTNGIVLAARAVPRNVMVKGYTLGASTAEVAVKVVLPQLLPQVIDSIRLTIGPAWVYLIAAEYLVAESGLGYRITLAQRYYGMNVILLYVVWITILGMAMDYGLIALSRFIAPWAVGRKDD